VDKVELSANITRALPQFTKLPTEPRYPSYSGTIIVSSGTHVCVGCDPRNPVAISNTLYAISDDASGENVRPIKFDVSQNEADCGTSCHCEAKQEIAKPASVAPYLKIAWPIETGDYRLCRVEGCVAIVTDAG
jgi:hypothetical protein